MQQARFRFYAELNDFLPRSRRQADVAYPFRGAPAVKDAVEALGVPHTEVEVILVNGVSVPFDHPLRDGDRVSVFPVFETLEVTPRVRLRPPPPRPVRFALDVHLGRLARQLRLFGFDTAYRNDWSDEQLAELAPQERRIVLTRDRGLLMRRAVTHGYYVRATQPDVQLIEVLRRFGLSGSLRPLTRCLVCNGVLVEVAVDQVGAEDLPADVRADPSRLVRCGACRRVYWDGSHVRRLRALVAKVEGQLQGNEGRGVGNQAGE
jgi:uncharacterized protein with PIN domain/sulfur carrier protein ThiS